MAIDPTTINLLSPTFYAGDPYPTYAWLRENAPVFHDEARQVWGISRYADIVAIEKNPRLYSSSQGSRPRIPGDPSMINRDDPHHHTMRRLVSPRFTPRSVRAHEVRVRDRVTGLIDCIAKKGSAEVVEELAAPLPAMVINEWLGFPEEMWEKCKWWSEVTMLAGGQHTGDGTIDFSLEGAGQALVDFSAAVLGLAEERRKEPKDDLISIWANKEVDGEKLDDSQIVSEALLVLDGGAETTRAVIASTVMHLIEFPEQRKKLIDGADMNVAVEEFIRYVTPILNMRRTVVETHEFGGQMLKEGDELLLMYASANRDPEHFDAPDTYDVARKRNQHLAFGLGTHFCLGASVARMELRIFFEELLRRLPDFRLAAGDAPAYVPSVFTRGPGAVHIEFTPEG